MLHEKIGMENGAILKGVFQHAIKRAAPGTGEMQKA